MTPTLKLTAFGGLALSRAGTSPEAAFGQRRPLAIMAMLAAAGDVGVSRDKLTATLWPDADVERGRKALAQALYSLRKAAGHPELFVGVADIRLNRACISVDAIAFDDAIRDGSLAEAVAMYGGPFCDGFGVWAADEFERWVDNERARYDAKCASALRRLIRDAQRDSDREREIEWSKRLVAIDPVESSSALILIDALARSGDIAGALRCGRLHEAIVRDRLEMPLSSVISERLKALDVAQADAISATAGARTPVVVSAPPLGTPVLPARDNSASVKSAPNEFRFSRRFVRTAVMAAGGISLVVSGLFLVRTQRPVAVAQAAPPMRPDVIAIIPFTIDSHESGIRFLGEGSADLMARMLAGSVGPRAVDPGAVLAVLDSLPTPRTGASRSAVNSHAREVSRRLGAGEAIVGRISGTSASITLTASIIDVASGEERASTEVSGAADSISSHLEAVATRLVAQTTIGDDRASAFFNARFSLLRLYLQAEAAYHADNYKEAAALYQQTLRHDSAFAPAALGLALAADRLNSAEQHDRGVALAWAAREKLSERDRSYLVALAGPRYPEPSPVGEQLSAWENVVALNPDRSTAWLELGERLLYDGRLLGIVNSDARASAVFRRAIELDPADQRGRRHLIQIAAKNHAREEMERLISGSSFASIGGELTGYLTWRVALARGDPLRLQRIRERFPSLGELSLRAIAMASQHDIVGLEDGNRALRLLTARAALGSDQLDVLLAQHSLALNQRRVIMALDITERLQDALPGSRAHLRLRVLDALYADGDSAAAEKAVDELERVIARVPMDGYAKALRLADLCVVAQWRAAPWRTTARPSGAEMVQLRRMTRELRGSTALFATVPVGASPLACGEIVEAMLAVRRRSRDAHSRVERLDDVMLSGPALGDATAWATLATARLYELLGNNHRALAVVQQRPYMKGWPRYLGASLRQEAKLAESVGDERARTLAWRRYEAFRPEGIR